MHKKQTTHKYTPHIRYWKRGQISVSATTQIESLVDQDRQREARSMAAEWIIDTKK